MESRAQDAIREHVRRALTRQEKAQAELLRAREYLSRAAVDGSSISIRSAISEYEAAYSDVERARLVWEDAQMLAVMAGVEV